MLPVALTPIASSSSLVVAVVAVVGLSRGHFQNTASTAASPFAEPLANAEVVEVVCGAGLGPAGAVGVFNELGRIWKLGLLSTPKSVSGCSDPLAASVWGIAVPGRLHSAKHHLTRPNLKVWSLVRSIPCGLLAQQDLGPRCMFACAYPPVVRSKAFLPGAIQKE